MFTIYLSTLLFFILNNPPTNISAETLPIINLTEDPSSIDINIHDIANVEYIPLGKSVHSPSTKHCSSFWISDDYIITHDITLGNIIFFDREGKYLWSFNKKGERANEYKCIILLAIDFNAKECFISDGTTQLYVYSFKGDFKRILTIPSKPNHEFTVLFNYDNNYLIGYNGSYAYDIKEGIGEAPYCLIDKRTGSISSLDFVTKHYISPVVYKKEEIVSDGTTLNKIQYMRNPLLKNGTDFLITDYASDTIFQFANHKLSPIAVRSPKVHETSTPIVIVPWLYTDYYLYFRKVTMKYDPIKKDNDSPELVWNRKTNKLERWNIYDPNYSYLYGRAIPHSFMLSSTVPNYGIGWFSADKLIDRYKAGELKGKLKQIAENIKDTDNRVLMLCKFK